ncbi:MAG: diguanylate cyclase [Myxococcota bacterium]|nr:diguanylate cyclase [Myxococcota bacterium]
MASALVLLCSLLLPTPLIALNPKKAISQYTLRTWGASDGLPQMSVLDVFQSRDGYLWIATQEGIARFDGVRFTVFGKSDDERLLGGAVVRIAQTSNGELWFGTELGGIVRYREKDQGFEWFTAKDGLPSDHVLTLAAGSDGALWIGTDSGLARYQGGEFRTFGVVDGLPHAEITELVVDKAGLWIGTKEGLARLEGGKIERVEIPSLPTKTSIEALHSGMDGTLWISAVGQGLIALRNGQTSTYGVGEELKNDRIDALVEDKDGALWIGTVKSGLVRMADGEFSSFSAKQGLGNDWVLALTLDQEGNLWVGTLGGGLSCFVDAKVTPFGQPEGLDDSRDVRVIMQDSGDDMWIGTNVGLSRFHFGKRVSFHGEELFAGRMVTEALEDSRGRLWFGTFDNGLWRLRRNQWRGFSTENCLSSMRVSGLAEREDGTIWLGSPAGAVQIRDDECTTFGLEEGLPTEKIRFAVEDSRGVLWVGTFGRGLLRLRDGQVEEVRVLGTQSQDKRVVLCSHEDAEGTLWFGTNGGLLRIGSDGDARYLTEIEGLGSYTALCILEDDANNLWISSNDGIFKVSKQQLEELVAGKITRVGSERFDADDGMRAAECIGGTMPACWRTRDGRLWFGTINGAAIIDPKSMPQNRLPPPVAIERILFDNAKATGEPRLRAAAGTRTFEFDYTALSFIGSERLAFKYLLEGFDSAWVDAGTRRVAYYTSIPPGDYTFRVKAANTDGLWNDTGASVSFTLAPLFHQTIAFKVALAMALVLFGLALASLRIRRLRRREKNLMMAVEAHTADLRKLTEELRELALIDPLTGLRNRRFLFETVPVMFENLAAQHREMASLGTERRANLGKEVFAAFLVDIDFFKEVNDTYGHDAGDLVLKKLASVLRGCIRADDVLVRWGGEEFLIILPHTDRKFPAPLGERIRAAVEATPFELPSGERIHKTCSLGYATFPFFERSRLDVDLDQLISLADFALRRAKETGRNRCLRVRSGQRAPMNPDELLKIVTSPTTALASAIIRIES